MIFSKADKNSSGQLDMAHFQEVVGDIIERYPQVDIYLKKKQMKNIMLLLRNSQDSKSVMDIETFKSCLAEVDSQMKNLPATAQVHAKYHTPLI